MNRHIEWERRLHDFIAANRERPHDYETQWDCMVGLFAGTVEAITGEDIAAEHRGKYKSHASAYRYLQSIGHTSVESFIDSLFDEKPIGFAGRGDIVLVRTESGDNPGVVMGDFALVVGEQGTAIGLVRAPRALWLKAWAVGEHHSSWPE